MADGVRIGEICRRTGCTPRTIRHYEKEGLLAPLATTAGGRKVYGEETVARIGAAKVLQRLGYSLQEIRGILALTKSGNTKDRKLTRKLRSTLSSSLAQIQNEIDLLTEARGQIAGLLKNTKVCEGCGAPDCAPCGRLKDLRTLGLLAPEEERKTA